MKKILTLAVATLVLTSNFALASNQLPHKQWKGGSKCGLTDDYGSDLWKEIGKSLDLGERSKVDLRGLPTLVKQQLIIAANRGVDAEHADLARNTEDAVAILREGSEAGDLYVSSFEYNGNQFTQVLTYGGGNPTGVIYAKGTLHIVAEIGDSDVICVK